MSVKENTRSRTKFSAYCARQGSNCRVCGRGCSRTMNPNPIAPAQWRNHCVFHVRVGTPSHLQLNPGKHFRNARVTHDSSEEADKTGHITTSIRRDTKRADQLRCISITGSSGGRATRSNEEEQTEGVVHISIRDIRIELTIMKDATAPRSTEERDPFKPRDTPS